MSSHRRGPWSQAEDAYLAQLVHTQGAMNWVRIAQLLGSRSPKQCRERYHQNLKPSLNHEPISPEEGLQIERMVGEMGKRWAEISRRLNGRSDIAVKNWWNGSMNRRRRLVVQRRSQDVYTVSPATANNNHNTQNTIKTPIGYSTYSTTHLPAQWPPDNRWEARMPAEMNEISGELSASTSNNDPPKFLNTRPDQISLPPLRQYMRTPWDGVHMSVDVNDEAAAESHEHLLDNFTVFSKDSGYKSAKSMPNSNASTSKESQPVSRNTRNGVNDSQPLGAGQAEGEPRKSLSDTSHDSGFSGTTLSGLGETEVKGAPQELAEILANHPELRPLILQATEEMDPRRFDKVFIRLLKTCAIDLRGEAKTPLEKGAVRIIYNYRAYATSLIRDEFTSRGHEKVSAMNRLKFQKVEDKMKLEMFIENYQQKSTERQDIQMNEDDEEDDKLSMGSDYNDPDEPDLRNLRKVRGFITSSAAFSNLKSNLEDFLIPTSDGSKPVIPTLQTCMEDIQWHPATADRRSSTKRKSPENEEEMSHQVKWPKLDESNDEKNHFTLDADGEGGVEGDTFGAESLFRQPITFLRPSDSSVDIDVTMKDFDIEHQVERQLQEIGHSNSNDHYSSSKQLRNPFIFHAGPDPKYHPQPSELPVLITSHHFSLEQETANELHDMNVLGTPTLSTAGNGKVEPAFVDDVNEERAWVLQTNLQACSSSMGAHNLNIHRPALAIDNFSRIEDENCSFRGSTLQDPAKTITDGQLIQHRSSSSTSQKMWGLLKRRWRPLLRPGHRRLDWVCGCGNSLYADLKDDGGPTLAKLSAILRRPTTATPSSNPNFQAQSLTPMQPIHHSSFSIPRAHNSQHSPTRSLLNQSNVNHISHGLLQTPLNSTPPKSPQFLELCVNIGEYLKVLGEIPTGNISNDQELFQSIKKKYLELRGFRARFWLLKPSAVNYVHISVENCHRVGILEKPLALPPKIEVDAKRYTYDPCPLVGGIPIPDHIFLHYMNCPNPSSKDAWLGRLPKKLDTSITHNAPAVTYGWGVHIDEGPNYGAIAWMNFFVLLLSGAAAALWNFYRKDFQGAFGFSCWIIAVLNSLMIGYFFRWKNE